MVCHLYISFFLHPGTQYTNIYIKKPITETPGDATVYATTHTHTVPGIGRPK